MYSRILKQYVKINASNVNIVDLCLLSVVEKHDGNSAMCTLQSEGAIRQQLLYVVTAV